MSSKKQLNSSTNENTCCVCYKAVEIYSIGNCDHPVCYECSTRMRVLCKQTECPICRGEMPTVVFTREILPFPDLKPNPNLREDRYGLHFYSRSIEAAYYRLLEFNCTKCDHRPFRNFQTLKDHMRKEHELFYCDLCVENLKIFAFERKSYTRSELATHRRKGDDDNKSHRGHPLCEFCDKRYMDSDDLFRHLRREHLYCHICDADGKHQYYSDYQDLRAHFLEDHFLCEEGDCKNEQLTSVFRTEIDYKAHVASVHSKQLGRAAIKQARTLEVEFNFAPRRNDPGGQRGGRKPNNNSSAILRVVDDSSEGAVGYSTESKSNSTKQLIVTNQNYPPLGNADPSTSTTKSSVTFTSKLGKPNFTNEEFPSLGGAPVPVRPSVSAAAHKPTAKGEDFPALGKRKNVVTISKNSNSSPPTSLQRNNDTKTASSTLKLTLNPERPQSMRPNLSIQVNHKSNGTVTTRISTAPTASLQFRPMSLDAFPALGTSGYVPPVQQQQWVQPKPKKTQEPKSSRVAPAPTLPTSSLSDFPSLSKKTSSVTMPMSSTWVNRAASTNDIPKSNNPKNNKDNNKANAKKKPTNNNDNNKTVVVESEASTKPATKSKKKKGGATTTSNNYSNAETSNERNNNNNNKNTNGIVKKTSTLKIGALEVASTSNENDFPALNNKAPPGISIKPPPGFNFASQNDLTFTNSSGQSYSILPTTNAHSYYMPSNFKSRNLYLIADFMNVLETNDAMNEFKRYSDLFRNENYPAEKFYEHCKFVLRDAFDKIFPELLVLLPDIEKQQDLYSVYQKREKVKNAGLEECATCKQIIFARELKQHLNNHYMENHFPSLGQSAGETNNVWKK